MIEFENILKKCYIYIMTVCNLWYEIDRNLSKGCWNSQDIWK